MKATRKQHIGKLGEDIAAKFLVKRGYAICERNYRKKIGEIDIVCQKDGKLHFVEVKTVSRETTIGNEGYRPEEHVHEKKLKSLYRVIEVFLAERNIDLDWQLDIVAIIIDHVTKEARVRTISNIIS